MPHWPPYRCSAASDWRRARCVRPGWIRYSPTSPTAPSRRWLCRPRDLGRRGAADVAARAGARPSGRGAQRVPGRADRRAGQVHRRIRRGRRACWSRRDRHSRRVHRPGSTGGRCRDRRRTLGFRRRQPRIGADGTVGGGGRGPGRRGQRRTAALGRTREDAPPVRHADRGVSSSQARARGQLRGRRARPQLTYAAAARLTDPDTPPGDGWIAAALAKAAAGDAAVGCARTAVQVHGALGQTWEHDAHLYTRHAWQGSALLGDSRALYHEVGCRFAGGAA